MAGELPVTCWTTVAELIDQFLVWVRENKAPGTYDWYFNHCDKFVKYCGLKLRVTDKEVRKKFSS